MGKIIKKYIMYQTLNHNPSRVGAILCLSYQLFRYSKITHQLQVTYTEKLTLSIEIVYPTARHLYHIDPQFRADLPAEVCFDILNLLDFVTFIALRSSTPVQSSRKLSHTENCWIRANFPIAARLGTAKTRMTRPGRLCQHPTKNHST